MAKPNELKGLRFGRLVVQRLAQASEVPRSNAKWRKYNRRWWIVLCDCGKLRCVYGSSLTSQKANTRSCGCLRKVSPLRKAFGEAAKWMAFRQYQKNMARTRGREWCLTLEQFLDITSKPCHYCGLAWSRTVPNKNNHQMYGVYKFNGIDRMNNTAGYTITNSVPCCKFCNRAKDTMTVEEFLEWSDRLYEHRHGILQHVQ